MPRFTVEEFVEEKPAGNPWDIEAPRPIDAAARVSKANAGSFERRAWTKLRVTMEDGTVGRYQLKMFRP